MSRDVVWSFIVAALGLFAAMVLFCVPAAHAASGASVQSASMAPMNATARDAKQTLSQYPVAQTFDRVKAVPKKACLKRRRLELTPEASLSLNDGFYEHLGFGGSAVYYPHDAWGVGLATSYLYAHPKLSAVDEVRQGLMSAPAAFDLPSLLAHLDFYWIPIYGKVSLPGGGIAQFDLYASAGAGVATAFGVHNPVAISVALGQHYTMNSWSALRLEVRDTLFLDRQQASGVPRSSVQSYVMLAAGISFFLPPTFEYTYP